MGTLTNSLKDAVRKLAYNTSVDQLKKRGVKKVNVLGIDRIVSLIEEAVHRSLRRKLLAVDRDEVADATKEEFLKLLRHNEDLVRSRDELKEQQELAQQESDELRLELQRGKQELDEKLEAAQVKARGQFEIENEELGHRIEEIFEGLHDGDSAESEAVRLRITDFLMTTLDGERKKAIRAMESARDRDVDLLERRITKLNESLEVTERNLLQAQVEGPAELDSGIASRYREVQGLDAQDAKFGRKQGLMADIFKANLLLQKGDDD